MATRGEDANLSNAVGEDMACFPTAKPKLLKATKLRRARARARDARGTTPKVRSFDKNTECSGSQQPHSNITLPSITILTVTAYITVRISDPTEDRPRPVALAPPTNVHTVTKTACMHNTFAQIIITLNRITCSLGNHLSSPGRLGSTPVFVSAKPPRACARSLTSPNRTAPHRTAPHRTAPHRTASHRIARLCA